MSDFVDRVLGRPGLPPIRPLIPTLFEPLRRSEPDEPLPLGVFSDNATPIPVAENPVHSDAPTVSPAPAELRLVSAPPSAAVVPVHLAQPPVHQTTEVHANTQHLHTHQRPATVVAARLTAEPTAPPAEPLVAQRRPAVVVDVESPSAAPAVPAEPKTITAFHHHETVVGSDRVQCEPRRRTRAAEPDVHISIGRVEIRAGQDGKAARQRTDSRKSPRLGLDEYLRGREVDRR